jgi:DNA modification methylase
MTSVASNSVGMVVTSPPYLNAIDYLRGHRMSLVWLAHTVGELRTIRSDSIGAERRLGRTLAESPLAGLSNELGIEGFAPRLRGLLERYLVDMDELTSEIHRVLRPGSEAVMVVGNSTIKGEYVDNATFAASAAQRNGMMLEERSERELPANSRYLPPPREFGAGHLAKRMRNEVILRMRKPLVAGTP